MVKFYFDKFIYKYKSTTKNMLVSILAITCALIFALLIAAFVYQNGALFHRIIIDIFTTPFKLTTYSSTLSSISIFVLGSLSFVFAFRSGLFNIGISGQMLFGAILATIMAQYMHKIPTGLGQLLMLLISVIGATFIASLIGFLKAFLNLNEVVTSIMFNWIIYFVGTYLLIATHVPLASDGSNTMSLPDNLALRIGGDSWLPLIIIALVCTIFIIILLGSTTVGKKIIHCGMSTTGAKYAGYNVKANQIMAMAISGALAGVMGVMIYCGLSNSMPVTSLSKTIPVEGFNSISVGLISMSNPWAIVPVSVFFGMIDGAKASIASLEGVDSTITNLMFGIIVYGAAIVSLFYYIVPLKWYFLIFKGKRYALEYGSYLSNINEQIDNVSDALYYLHKHSKKKINSFEYEKDSFDKFKIQVSESITKEQYKLYRTKIYDLYKLYRQYCYVKFLMGVYEGTDQKKMNYYLSQKNLLTTKIKQRGDQK